MLIQGAGIDSVFPPDRNNVAPRFGFAFQPSGWATCGNTGRSRVFYDQINMNPFLDFRPPISAADGLQDNPVGPAAVSNFSSEWLQLGRRPGRRCIRVPRSYALPQPEFQHRPGTAAYLRPTERILTTCTRSTRTSGHPTSLTTTCRSRRVWAVRQSSRLVTWAVKDAS